MTICNVRKRAANWSPLSPEARDTIRREPSRWDYVELWDGAAAQMNAFGATRRAPDLFTRLEEPEPEAPADPSQMSLDL